MNSFLFKSWNRNGDKRRTRCCQAGNLPRTYHSLKQLKRYQPEILSLLDCSITGFFILVGFGMAGPGGIIWAAEVNAVGYVNAVYAQGYELIADPLSEEANRVDQTLPSVAEGTQLVKFDGRNWLTNEFVGGAWTVPEMTLSPGEAALLRSPSGWTKTWVGSILQGELKVFIPAGGSLRSSLVPQAGKLSEILEFPRIIGTRIFTVDNGAGELVLRATCTEAGWQPEEPVLGVGEGFYVDAPQDFVWSRLFAVNGQSATSTAIRVITQPQSRQINPGDSFSLSVEATSTNQLFYQWQRNGNDLPGATGSTLVVPSAGPENLGSYWVRIWDHKSWLWSDAVRIQFAGAQAPSLAISRDGQGNGVLLRFRETTGRKAIVEVSTDLIHWVEGVGLDQIDASSVLDQFHDQPTARFYRLRLD